MTDQPWSLFFSRPGGRMLVSPPESWSVQRTWVRLLGLGSRGGSIIPESRVLEDSRLARGLGRIF
ncbi:UNVERIFIED_CONTAM: hypothetical protein FKN15_050328 [Acipenser sinensis]